MIQQPLLTIQGLSKQYGRFMAVNHLDLEVEVGQVYGLLGPNGSGKTTTLGMVLGVVRPTAGTFSWYGLPSSASARRKVGAILEMPAFFPYLDAVQNLQIVSAIKKIPRKEIERCLSVVNLLDRRNDKFKTFSLGMKQRLAIAAALLCDPGVLILDEPTNGLDPQGIAEIRDLIRSIAASGKTIILASHLLDEVQKVCTHFAVLKKGKKIYSGQVAEVLGSSNEVEVNADDAGLLKSTLGEVRGVENISEDAGMITVKINNAMTPTSFHAELIRKGIVLSHFSVKRKSLERQFLELLANEK